MPFRADRNEHLLSQPARTSPWPGRGSADVLLRSIPLALIHIVTGPAPALFAFLLAEKRLPIEDGKPAARDESLLESYLPASPAPLPDWKQPCKSPGPGVFPS